MERPLGDRVEGPNGEHICTTEYDIYAPGRIGYPDARLIAAAPDLLEALRHVAHVVRMGCPESLLAEQNMDLIRDAIAKATAT